MTVNELIRALQALPEDVRESVCLVEGRHPSMWTPHLVFSTKWPDADVVGYGEQVYVVIAF